LQRKETTLDLTLLETLTQTFGPSGYEDAIRRKIAAAITDLADETRVDALGSLIAFRKGTQDNAQKIMIAAHMDEIGLMVTHVDNEGFLRFTSIGGVRAMANLGGRAQFSDGTVASIYVERQERAELPQLHHLYLDIGATSRKTCPIGVGETAVFVGPLIHQGHRLISKAMDDRIGCYILIEVLRRLESSPNDLYFAFTTQEEITLSGARTSAFRINPDIAISVDVTATGDTPKALPMDVQLDKGPAIKVKDGGMVAHPRVKAAMIEAAERADLPYQLEILTGGTTDAAAMQLVQSGVPSGCLSVPCRYVHTTSEMVSETDVEQGIELLVELLAHTAF
jgi:tetrahedral aminopeptidase